MKNPTLGKRLAAEFLGTFWLVFGGCGSAIFAAVAMGKTGDGQPFQVGIGYVGVALAFGLTVLTMAYAVGHVSGGHFNPAVSIGTAIAGRTPWKDVLPYIVTQVIAGLVAGAVLLLIASGKPGFSATGNMAANGYGANSPDGYSLVAALVIEIVLTMFFLFVILGATDARAPKGFGPIAIGLALTLIHLISIPVTNTSVNPARSTAVAFFNGAGAPGQLWLFWVAPIVGAALAGVLYKALLGSGADTSDRVEEGQAN
ncbi:aquaporin Z [Enemella evansiae]|uniref:Aquaporin Z n=1 Tax=Enemella evansiae TaxID=2016499 RepID=A0A255GEY2_9ACTN|nr:aquaporin Z [Enemella evansiae]OYO05024.1 aquaporin Z [Enemella evansiae]OYO14390.1 aquaporin Z [Enemella evansiae]